MVRLEAVALSHAPALQVLLEDPAIAETTPFPSPYPPDGAATYIADAIEQRAKGTRYVFAVHEPNGPPVGMTLLKDVDAAAGVGELGYWIGKPFWGRGLATAAALATVGFAFDTLGLRTLRAVCLETNLASRRVLAKLGFVPLERTMQSLPKWPEPRTSLIFRLAAAEWERGSRDWSRPVLI